MRRSVTYGSMHPVQFFRTNEHHDDLTVVTNKHTEFNSMYINTS